MGKLPYIPDKKMYAAVIGACSYIKATGYFNKATQYYADKYGVDVERVRKYVRTAQGNGQRQQNKRNPRKYKWYAVAVLRDFYEAGDDGRFSSWDWSEKEKAERTEVWIIKATSKENAKSQVYRNRTGRGMHFYFDMPHPENRVLEILESKTEEDANQKGISLKEKYRSCL